MTSRLRTLLRSGGGLSVVVALLLAFALLTFGITEEVPTGSLRGTVTMAENGRVLPNADVIVRAAFPLPEDAGRSRYAQTNAKGEFELRHIPAGSYMLDVYGRAHSRDSFAVLVEPGKTATCTVDALPSQPYLELHASQRVFTPKEEPRLDVNGLAVDGAIGVDVFRVDESRLNKTRSLEGLLRPLIEAYTGAGKNLRADKAPFLTKVRHLSVPITQRDIEGVFVQPLALPKLPEGSYVVRAQCAGHHDLAWLSVTQIAMVTKTAGRQALAFVTDIETGKPVPGAKITYVDVAGPKEVGKTGPDGVLQFRRAMAKGNDRNRMVVAASGASRAFTWFYDYGLEASEATLWAETDRPVYRPGDRVQFRGVVRDQDKSGYRLPAKPEVKVLVTDSDDEKVYEKTLALNEMGSFSGEFAIDEAASLDGYNLRVDYGDSSLDRYVSIAAYRKPEYRITVTPEKPYYVRGDRARMRVKCETYTGEPAVGAEVRASVYRNFLWRVSPFSEEYEDYYADDEEGGYGYGDRVAQMQLQTDRSGECVVEFDTSAKENKEADFADANFTVSVGVTDPGGKTFDGEGSVRVVRGEIDLEADFDSYVLGPGAQNTLHIRSACEPDGRPLANQQVLVEYGHERWHKDVSTFVIEGRRLVQLDEQGRAEVTVQPTTEGDFTAKVSVRDWHSNTVRAEANAWVFREGADTGAPAPQLQVVLDKKLYQPGEQAKALIRTSATGGVALVTVETESVVWAKAVPLNERATLVAVPALRELAPNGHVSVAYVFKKRFMEAQRILNVDLTERRLNLTVTPDRPEAKPGETVEYLIKASTPEGRPARAECSLGVVDESIFAIRKDRNKPLEDFYPRRYPSVQTSYSFPEIYLDGDDKSPANLEVRRKFADTAFWNPSVMTDAQGQARVAVRLPDNLTQWRATVTAFTAQTEIGKTTAMVTARKDLMARLSLPSFLTQGDRQQIVGTLANATDQPLKVHVRLEVAGVQATGPLSRDVTVAPRTTEAVSWNVSADRPGEALVRLLAWTDRGPNDALERRFPVNAHGVDQVAYYCGTATKALDLRLNRSSDAMAGEVTVTLSPDLATSLSWALDYLVDYPYGCVEQTMSRFVPAVLVQGYMQASGVKRPDLEAKIPKVAKMSLRRIRTMQHEDGGWGWWEHDDTSEGMTALVLDGLWRAQKAGVRVSPRMLRPALDWAKTSLKKPLPKAAYDWEAKEQVRGRIYLGYAVSLYDATPEAIAALRPPGDQKKLSTQSLANLTVAWHRIAMRQSGGEAQRSLRERDRWYALLFSRADEAASYLSWPDEGCYEDTGAALEAVALVEPNSKRMNKALNYLMLHRRGAAWCSTRDTALVLMAATEGLTPSREPAGDRTVVVSLNGRVLETVRLTQGALPSSGRAIGVGTLARKLRVPLAGLASGDNALRVQVLGGGSVQYSVAFRQTRYVKPTRVGAGTEGLTLTREYFRLEPQRLESGALRMRPSKRPISSLRSGEVYRCRLTIQATKPHSYLMVEDPIPSNCRIVEPVEVEPWEEWTYDYSGEAYFDDHATFFFDVVRPGKRVIEYAIRAESPGTSLARPAEAYRMYQPDARARSGSMSFEVKR